MKYTRTLHSERTKVVDQLHSDLATMKRVLTAEAQALTLLSQQLDNGLATPLELCFHAQGRIICAGVGKSGHVARKIAATLSSTGAPAQFVHPTEASHGDMGMITQKDVVLALSRSGETAELADLIQYTKRFDIPLLGMTAIANSALGRASDHLLMIPDLEEACAITAAPTTSTTLMMALGDALAVALLERKGFKKENFRDLHPGGKLGSMLKKVSDLMYVGENVPLITSGSSFEEAILVLSQKRLGCVGVVSDQNLLLGILTDGDIRRIVLEGRVYEKIEEAMTKSPITTTPDMLAQSAVALMNEKNITQLFVTENGACLGVLHIHELLKSGVV